MLNNQSKADRYLSIRNQTEKITSPLKTEDFVAQPIEDVSPPKWHLGHTTWFFENFILKKHLEGYKIFNADFAFIFNSYYESQGSRILRGKRGTLTRPSTEAIFEYRKYVDECMLQLLQSSEQLNDELLTFFEVGLNHEQQHQELLVTDIKYILGTNPLLPVYADFKIPDHPVQEVEWLEVKAGNYPIGYAGKEFHFDNEEGEHTVYVHDFKFQNRLVNNAEYLEFINDNGYTRPEFWLMEGWEWVKQNQSAAPCYWAKEDGMWLNYKLNGLSPVKDNETLTHINFYEADAFACWKKCRLLTEFEWEVAAEKYGFMNEKSQFLEKGIYHPVTTGENQLFGTAWEWTNSAYLPYPFYQQEEGALGEYNGKFMINQMVLRGGSCATPKSHFRKTYRNFFHPHLQWQFTGIRLAK